jgi:hypothetical protein
LLTKTTTTIFGLKQFFDVPKLQSKDKNLLFFAFESQLLFPYLFLHRVVSVCCHQSLKKKQRCQSWFVQMHKTKLRDCVEEFYRAGPNASAKFFFWRVLSKKKTDDLRKGIKNKSLITKQSDNFFGFVYYKFRFLLTEFFFLKKFTVVSVKKSHVLPEFEQLFP